MLTTKPNRQRHAVFVTLLLVLSAIAAPAFAAQSSRERWGGTNSNVKSHAAGVIRYPVIGTAVPGQWDVDNPRTRTDTASDDSCYAGASRGYYNGGCFRTKDAHAGNDIFPTVGFAAGSRPAANGELPVVAARGGRVTRATCDRGYGVRVSIWDASTGQTYHYLHMTPNSLAVSIGQQVMSGQRLGDLGYTRYSCSTSAGSTGRHLHFEIDRGEWEKPKQWNARSPYTRLRSSFSGPGRNPGPGSQNPTQNTAMVDAWNRAVATKGGYPSAVRSIGWPTGSNFTQGAPGSAKVHSTGRSGASGRYGQKQYLGNGSCAHARMCRSGAIFWAQGVGAQVVHGSIFAKYYERAANGQSMERSEIGFPTSGEMKNKKNRWVQLFEGGCISNYGLGYQRYALSNNACAPKYPA